MTFFAELTHQKMTVGKIYAGLLIAENWRAYKASQSRMNGKGMVSLVQEVAQNTLQSLSYRHWNTTRCTHCLYRVSTRS